jgi:hypothetical protein
MAAETLEALQAAVASEQEAIGSLRERLNAFGRALIGVSSDPSFFHSLHLLIVTRERLLEQAAFITESGSLDDATWAERVHGQVMALADASKAYLSFTGHACAKAASDTGETIFASDIAASGMTADDFQVRFALPRRPLAPALQDPSTPHMQHCGISTAPTASGLASPQRQQVMFVPKAVCCA